VAHRQQLFASRWAVILNGPLFSRSDRRRLIGSNSWGSSQVFPYDRPQRADSIGRATPQFLPAFTLFQPVSESRSATTRQRLPNEDKNPDAGRRGLRRGPRNRRPADKAPQIARLGTPFRWPRACEKR